MSRNDAQQLSDAMMGVLQTVFDELATLRNEVDDLRSARRAKVWMDRTDAAAYLCISVDKLDMLRGDGRLRTHFIDSKPAFHVDDLDEIPVADAPVRLVS